ncbi:MAG: acylneuraminate cytidylyltransferase family protein [Anaerolineaceae bacterium]|nr:acylneuraminate cytidylyltransferase family protein [Anaerolineaceae bacterium]
MKKRIVALVPMRHHSQRVPGKNYRPLAGKPLFHHIVDTLMKCPEIDEIVVDTDSTIIIESIRMDFPQVKILERPEHLRADEIPMNEILLYDTSQVESDLYLQTHSTNPLLKSETISKAIQVLLADYPTFDSLFGVTRLQTRLWDSLTQPINHNPAILLQTQDLPPVYEENSCIYLFTRDVLERKRNRLGDRPMMYEIEVDEAWDIDEELDFTIVDLLLQKRSAEE